MKVSTFGISVLLSLSIAVTSSAQKQKEQDPCANAQTTIEMRDCAGREYKKADDELNKVYRQLMSTLADEGYKAALKAAQQAWIKYRDANCEFESYLNRGGTIEPVVRFGCLASMTASRTKELKDDIKQFNHDVRNFPLQPASPSSVLDRFEQARRREMPVNLLIEFAALKGEK